VGWSRTAMRTAWIARTMRGVKPLMRSVRAVSASPSFPWVTAGVLAIAALYEIGRAGWSPLSRLGAATMLATVPLAAWRRYPVWVAYLVIVASVASYLVFQGLLVAPTAGALVGLCLLARGGPVLSRALRMAGVIAVLAVPLGGWSDRAGFAALFMAVAVVAAGAIVDASRSRSAMRRERQAAMARVIAAERQQAAMAERARIARELHDLVAHSVSVIAVQAELSPHSIAELSPGAREGFQQIARSARSAMTELRQLLDVLRTDEVAVELAPQPMLEAIGELADQHRASGGSVEVRTHGSPRPLAAALELSGYRIVQEALTNIRRHAPGAAAQVDIGYGADRLTIRVSDDGPGPARERQDQRGRVEDGGDGAPSPGHGLVGMRERAAMLGGRISAGPRPEGGFVVDAELPCEPAEGTRP
jgi:signal transduction histidine kinase